MPRDQGDDSRASSGLYPTLAQADSERRVRLGRWDWQVRADRLEWSDAIFGIFGVSPEEFHGRVECFFKRVHPDDRERVEEEVRLALEEGKPYSVYHRIIRPSGELRVVHEQAEVVLDEAGRPVRMAGTVQDITEWRKTREALELLDLAVRTCITPIVTVDSNIRFTYVNTAFVELMGAEDESQLLGRRAVPLERSSDQVMAVVSAARKWGGWKGELTITRADGTPLPVEVNAALVKAAGRPEEFVVSFIDLSDLRRTERELRQREAELQRILSSIDVVVYRDWFRCGEASEREAFVSPPVERLVGVSPDELSARPERWFEMVHPDEAESLEETLCRARVAGAPALVHYRIRNQRTGRLHWVEESMRPEVDSAGNLVGLFGTVRDVSEQKKSDRERAALQQLLRDVAREWTQTFDAIGVPILLVRWDGTIRRLNEAAAELAEGGFVGTLDRSLREISNREPWRSAAEILEEVRTREQALFREVRDPVGEETWHVTVSPAGATETSEVRWLVVILRNVTELYRQQESLRRREQMFAMGALVARAANELRNPLSGISATVDVLDAERGDDEGLAESIQVLRGEVRRMGRMLEDLLAYGRPISLDLSVGPISEVVRGAVSACVAGAGTAGVTVRSELADDLPPVEHDAGRMQQALQKLIENSVQHSVPGAEVVVWGEVDDDRGGLRLQVIDEGPGFDEGDLEHLVEPFFSRRQDGTGLGLWIVERILSEHGGSLRLGNRPEGGAVAEIRLRSGGGVSA